MNRIESRFLSRGPVTPIPEDKEAIAKAEYEYLKGKFEAYEFFNKENFFKQRERITKLVEDLDDNKDGVIDAKEFKQLAAQLGMPDVSIQDAERYIAIIDLAHGENARPEDAATLSVTEFYNWWRAPFEDWKGGHEGKVELIRIKLRAKDLPLDEIKGVRKVLTPLPAASGGGAPKGALAQWAMLKTAVKMATYYRTTWLNAPETEQEIEEAQKKAVAEGKRLLHVNFVRHGESEANLWWREHPGVCPWYFDPDLTPVGIEQAKARQKEIESLHVDVVVVSPLLRTLKTCKLVFSHLIGKVPFVVQPLCREQVTESDDIGKMKDTMEAQYPEYDWALVPEKQFWWYIPDDRKVEGENDLAGFNKRYKECGGWVEPVPVLANRVREFEAWLVSRPEASIAVVSHGDFIECMTGQNLRNAAHLMFEVDPLKPLEPKLDL